MAGERKESVFQGIIVGLAVHEDFGMRPLLPLPFLLFPSFSDHFQHCPRDHGKRDVLTPSTRLESWNGNFSSASTSTKRKDSSCPEC